MNPYIQPEQRVIKGGAGFPGGTGYSGGLGTPYPYTGGNEQEWHDHDYETGAYPYGSFEGHSHGYHSTPSSHTMSFPGHAGYPGTAGLPGAAGYPGHAGYPGAAGYSGAAGYPGTAGLSGAAGYPGTAGLPGQVSGAYPGGMPMAYSPGVPSGGYNMPLGNPLTGPYTY